MQRPRRRKNRARKGCTLRCSPRRVLEARAREAEAKAQRPGVIKQAEDFLREIIACVADESAAVPERKRAGRKPTVPALCLWAGMLVSILRKWDSQAALWRLLSLEGLWNWPCFEVCDQAIYKRLGQAGPGAMQRLFEQITQVLAVRLLPYMDATLAPFAAEVASLDETTLDQVRRTLPGLRGTPAGSDTLLPGKLAGLFDVRRQQWRKVLLTEEPRQNEKVLARSMVEDLPRTSLVLADLGYFAFEWFDDLSESGYFWASRLREKTTYEVLHVFYEKGPVLDALVFLGKYRADRTKHAVRLVQFRHGKQVFRYVTNVLDPRTFPVREIARLYARRWDIEMAFGLIKRELGLHLLWSAKPAILQQQIWAVLSISQILQALRLEIAGRAEAGVFDVSMSLMVQWLPRFAAQGKDPVQTFLECGRRAQMIRPSRRIRRVLPRIGLDQIIPLPEGTILERKPRYANRKC